MREQIEGSRAVAQTVARCRPQVVPAYPITPQTHIVEALGAMVKSGALPGCEFVTVESEFAAMSVALGASATGARAYTATASQGLLYMAEVLYNAAGLGMPVVLTVANRAIGAPINIWNDHSDSMSQRDCGWIQLHAADNQAAIALHVIAFRLAEQLSTPVMVCMDGFVLTHAIEALDTPDQDAVDSFLPPYRPRQLLDPAEPVTIGAMVGPAAFTEVRVLADRRLRQAATAYATLARDYRESVGPAPEPVAGHRVEGAELVLVTLGSVSATACDLADSLSRSTPFGVLTLSMYRPFPAADVRAALAAARHVVVLERAFSPGAESPVTADVRAALAGLDVRISTVVAGLGGRSVTSSALTGVIDAAVSGRLGPVTFLDADQDVLARESAEVTR